MKRIIIKIVSYLALASTILPSVLVLMGKLDIETNKSIMAVAMVVWFVTAPFWMNRKEHEDVVE